MKDGAKVFHLVSFGSQEIRMGGHGHHQDTTATKEEMKEARLSITYRDSCAGLLIPLNECRKETYSMPWKCGDLRHAYEKCQYVSEG